MAPNSDQLTDFFLRFLLARGVELDAQKLADFNFVESGLLDSFEILSMIIELETEFGLSLSPEELSDTQHATVGGLMKTLLEKASGASQTKTSASF